MRGGRRVIIEAHRHEGDYVICQHEYVCMHTHTHTHTHIITEVCCVENFGGTVWTMLHSVLDGATI